MGIRRFAWSIWIAGALVIGIAVPGAWAASITFSNSIPVTDTDFISSVSVSQFNPALGTLTSVSLSLSDTETASINVENTSSTGRTIGVSMSDTISVTGPTASTSLSVNPTISTSDALTAFDGTQDLSGADSASHPGLTNTVSASTTTSAAADLALFTGVGSIVFPVNAAGSSTTTAPSNVATDLQNGDGVTVTVTYNFTPRVAEPGALLFLGSALTGLAGLGFRRSSGRESA